MRGRKVKKPENKDNTENLEKDKNRKRAGSTRKRKVKKPENKDNIENLEKDKRKQNII